MSPSALHHQDFCWCGCKTKVTPGKYFAAGHDKLAEAAILALKYNGLVAQLLADNGFGPDVSVVDATVESGAWQRCETCGHPGNERTMNNHRQMHARSGRADPKEEQ